MVQHFISWLDIEGYLFRTLTVRCQALEARGQLHGANIQGRTDCIVHESQFETADRRHYHRERSIQSLSEDL